MTLCQTIVILYMHVKVSLALGPLLIDQVTEVD